MPPTPAAHRLSLHSTPAILRRAAFLLASLLPSLLLAALLLFSFRSALLAGVRQLSVAAEQNPSYHSLLSRLSTPPPPPNAPSPAPRRFRHVSSPADAPDALLAPSLSDADSADTGGPHNGTVGFLVIGNSALRYLSSSRNRVKVALPAKISSPFYFRTVGGQSDEQMSTQPRGFGIGLDRRDALVIIHFIILLSCAHAIAIVGFVAIYSAALGIVFTTVANHYLGRPTSAVTNFFSGFSLGVKRLSGFAFLRWAARDAIVQFLCLWFFSDVNDQTQLLKLFVAAKLMPFSLSSGSIMGMGATGGATLYGFFLTWGMLDTLVSMLFTLWPWVAIMDWNLLRPRHDHDAMKEGLYFVYLMPAEASLIKWIELTFCGTLGRTVLALLCGKVIGGVLYSLFVVYFMVVWLTFYLAARCKDAHLAGRRFELQDLADCIDRPIE